MRNFQILHIVALILPRLNAITNTLNAGYSILYTVSGHLQTQIEFLRATTIDFHHQSEEFVDYFLD